MRDHVCAHKNISQGVLGMMLMLIRRHNNCSPPTATELQTDWLSSLPVFLDLISNQLAKSQNEYVLLKKTCSLKIVTFFPRQISEETVLTVGVAFIVNKKEKKDFSDLHTTI